MKSNEPIISVVVCTYNGANKIAQCLQALEQQALDKHSYEIIVVNDGSTDNTADILKAHDIKVITNKSNQGLAESRNIGVLSTKAAIIAFTDDDCVADKNWLKNLFKAYSDNKVIGAGGKIIPYRTNTWLLKYYELNNPLTHLTAGLSKSSGILYRFVQYLKRSSSLNKLPSSAALLMIVGANMSMRRSVFEAVGGFDKSFRYGGDEEDFWERLRDLTPDSELRYVSTAIVRHDYNPYLKDALRRNYSYGVGSARLFLKYSGRIPAIYPFPFIILLSLILLKLSLMYAVLTLFMILILYPGWLRVAIRKRRPFYIFYAPIQALLEMTLSLGFVAKCISFTLSSRRQEV